MSFQNEDDAIIVAMSDETTDITVGVKVTMPMPYPFTLKQVQVVLGTSSSAGLPTFNLKKNGATVFSTKPTIDVGEVSSLTAATPSVLLVNPTQFAAGDVLSLEIDVAGTGAKGAKMALLGNMKGKIEA
jgi:hypothetical protein